MTILTGTVQERIALPPSARGMPTPNGGITPAEMFAMLRRRMILVIVLFLLTLSAAVGGFVVWWVYFPGYRSESLIECVSNIPDSGLTIGHERLRQEEHERFVSTQALLIKSPSILGAALQVNEVRETQWYATTALRGKGHLLELTDHLISAPVRGTNFLRVAFECRSKADPAVIVDAIVRLWLDTVRKRSADEFATDLGTAVAERVTLDERIADDRRQLQTIAARLPPGARQDPINNMVAQEVRQLSEQVAVLRLELSLLEQLRAVYNDPKGLAATAEERALVEQDPEVALLRQTAFLLEQQYAADASRYGSEHNVLRAITAQIDATRESLTRLETQKLFEFQASNREAAESAHANTRHALLLAQERLARAEAALQDQDRLLLEYTNLEADILHEAEYRKELNNYVQSLERVVRQRSAVNINVAQPATEPLERSSPSLLLLPLMVLLPLILSMGIALGLEALNTSVRTSQDVLRHLAVAMLGVVPDTDDEEVTIERVETAVSDSPRSMVAEAFRRIRTSLQFSGPAAGQRTVLITSPRPGDGKTTVAVNLAMAAAQAGRRVLLVDANLRRPELHGIFDKLQPQGLSNILVGDGSLETYAVESGTPHLDVLGAGPSPPNPAELLGNEQCRAFLESARSRYDQVIIDSTPIMVATDALVLATAVDGVVLVLRANRSSRGIARRTCGLLSDVGGHLFGVVLNAARVTRGGYFREQLRTYYEYQEQPEAKKTTPAAARKKST